MRSNDDDLERPLKQVTVRVRVLVTVSYQIYTITVYEVSYSHYFYCRA